MLHIIYAYSTNSLQNYDTYLKKLPVEFQGKNSKYKFWQDRQRHLIGILLLIEGLKKYNYSSNILNEIKYNEFQRPYLNKNIDFNISHSEELVVCAIGRGIRLGIDIEKIRSIDISDFKETLTHNEIEFIHSFQEVSKPFFDIWTKKESIIKADGRGLNIALNRIDVIKNPDFVEHENTIWYTRYLNIDSEYSCHLAVSKKSSDINFLQLYFN